MSTPEQRVVARCVNVHRGVSAVTPERRDDAPVQGGRTARPDLALLDDDFGVYVGGEGLEHFRGGAVPGALGDPGPDFVDCGP